MWKNGKHSFDMEGYHLRLPLLDYLDTTEGMLQLAEHQLGTFNGTCGLNTRDELKLDVRVNYKRKVRH